MIQARDVTNQLWCFIAVRHAGNGTPLNSQNISRTIADFGPESSHSPLTRPLYPSFPDYDQLNQHIRALNPRWSPARNLKPLICGRIKPKRTVQFNGFRVPVAKGRILRCSNLRLWEASTDAAKLFACRLTLHRVEKLTWRNNFLTDTLSLMTSLLMSRAMSCINSYSNE